MSGIGEPPLGGPKKTPSSSQSALSTPLQNVHLPENPIAAACRRGLAQGRETRRGQRVLRPIFLLKFFRPQRDQQVMNGEHRPDPARRSVAAREFVRDQKGDIRPQLRSAKFFRLQQIPQACVPEILNSLARESAGLVCRCSPLAQNRRQFSGFFSRVLAWSGFFARRRRERAVRLS